MFLTNQVKKINFVFKDELHISPNNIHSPKNTYFYKMLDQLGMVKNTYYSDKLPKECFVYEYEQKWSLDTHNFFGDKGFLELDPCPENVLQRIREKTALLLITMPFESPLQPQRITQLHNYIKKQNLPLTQVVYMTGCLNGQEVYESFCNSSNEKPVLNLEYIAENFFVHSEMAKLFSNKKYIIEPKEKNFLMFNRRWLHHPHRTLFLYYLHKWKILDDFYISFSKLDVDHQTYKYADVLQKHFAEFFKDENNLSLNLEDVNNLDNLLPLYLDTADLSASSLMFEKFKETSKFYDKSFINVISETYFYTKTTDILHLTEKTFKPILYKHPFIMLGPPFMLKQLKKLGFQTFHSVWDESYDEITDHTQRFFKVLTLCKQIHAWTDIEKLNAMEKCSEIINHNFSFLLNYYNNDTNLMNKFINKYNL